MVEANAAEWARFGVEPGWSFAIRHRVRWSECDPFGHANHRAYFEWFEEARNRYLEAVGLAEAGRALLESILFFAEDPELVSLVFQSACEFVSRVPVQRLVFVPDSRVWEMIR